MFYNIILSKPFADHYGLKTQDRHRPITPLISDYTRKSVAAFIEKYPNVGLLVCLGEAMASIDDDVKWMKEAIKQAKKAESYDEVPIGCVIVKDDKVIARGYNKRETLQQSIAHAEIMAIQKACKKLNTWRFEDCILYVTLEPCPMCAGAIIQSRIKEVVYGASDPKGGCVGTCTNLFEVSEFNHHPEYRKGILESECSDLLKHFFKKKRDMKKKQKS